MAISSINARPLVVAPKAAAPKVAPKVVAAPAQTDAGSTLGNAARTIGEIAPSTAIDIVGTALGMRTPPLIVDIFKDSLRSGFRMTNVAWFVVPSAFRNIRDIAKDKISVARGVANVASDTTIGIGKGIVAGVAVQSLSVAVGPLLGALPAAVLPFAGIGIGLVGMAATYFVLNKVIRGTGIDKKLSDGLTKLFGGDKAPAKA